MPGPLREIRSEEVEDLGSVKRFVCSGHETVGLRAENNDMEASAAHLGARGFWDFTSEEDWGAYPDRWEGHERGGAKFGSWIRLISIDNRSAGLQEGQVDVVSWQQIFGIRVIGRCRKEKSPQDQ